jgi:hypothetical protein
MACRPSPRRRPLRTAPDRRADQRQGGAWGARYRVTPEAMLPLASCRGRRRLPAECSIGFATGATMASFVCLAAARSRVLQQAGWNVDADGLFGAPAINVCIGNDAHAAIQRIASPFNMKTESVSSQRSVTSGRSPLPRERFRPMADCRLSHQRPVIGRRNLRE